MKKNPTKEKIVTLDSMYVVCAQVCTALASVPFSRWAARVGSRAKSLRFYIAWFPMRCCWRSEYAAFYAWAYAYDYAYAYASAYAYA